MSIGYSPRSLPEKLGLKLGLSAYFGNAPQAVLRAMNLPCDIQIKNALRGPLDFIHFFATSRMELERKFPALKKALDVNGLLWVSWPKRAAKVETDLDENVIREIGLAYGLVDVKVIAVDEVWSGLKFVFRKVDRK